MMYVMFCTRPHLAFGISVFPRFMANPGIKHWDAMKYLLIYMLRTKKLGLIFTNNAENSELICNVDSDYASKIKTRNLPQAFLWHGMVNV